MKKCLIIIIFFIFMTEVSASSGRLVQKSIITCNGVSYGYHSSDKHWHKAKKNSDDSYSAIGNSLGLKNPCSSKETTPDTDKENPIAILPTVETENKNERMDVTLAACVDGDTAKFNTNKGVEATRFLAIDTPESTNKKEEYGVEASTFTCNKLKSANKIVLEFDKNSDLYDKYNRLLAWVWIDGVLLQDEIIKSGLGEVAYLYGNYMYTSLLQDHQEIAKIQNLNIWSSTYSNDQNKNNDTNNNNLENDYQKINTEENEFLSSIVILIGTISGYLFIKNKKKKTQTVIKS